MSACIVFAALLGYLLRPTGQDIGNYRYTPFASQAIGPIWSPDGKAVAYAGKVNDIYQVFLRYLNSPVAVQLTHEPHFIQPAGWSSDRSHIMCGGVHRHPRRHTALQALLGRDRRRRARVHLEADCNNRDLSRDGKAYASIAKGPDDYYGVAVSDPLGSPLRY